MWARQRKGNLGFWEGKYKGKLMESKGYFIKLFVCFVGFNFWFYFWWWLGLMLILHLLHGHKNLTEKGFWAVLISLKFLSLVTEGKFWEGFFLGLLILNYLQLRIIHIQKWHMTRWCILSSYRINYNIKTNKASAPWGT